MKSMSKEKQLPRENRTNGGARRVQAGTRQDSRATLKTAADRQIAEIERTFSVRWEW